MKTVTLLPDGTEVLAREDREPAYIRCEGACRTIAGAQQITLHVYHSVGYHEHDMYQCDICKTVRVWG